MKTPLPPLRGHVIIALDPKEANSLRRRLGDTGVSVLHLKAAVMAVEGRRLRVVEASPSAAEALSNGGGWDYEMLSHLWDSATVQGAVNLLPEEMW